MEINPFEFARYISEYFTFIFSTLGNPRVTLKPIERVKPTDKEAIYIPKRLREPEVERFIQPKLIIFSIISIIIGVSLQNAMPYRSTSVDLLTPIIIILVMWTVLAGILFLVTPNRRNFLDFVSSILQVVSVHYVLASLFAFIAGIMFQVSLTQYFYYLWQICALPFFLFFAVSGDEKLSLKQSVFIGFNYLAIIFSFLSISLIYSETTGNNPFFPVNTATPTKTVTFTPTPTNTLLPTNTPSSTPSPTYTNTMTLTPSPTFTPTVTRTASPTPTPDPTLMDTIEISYTGTEYIIPATGKYIFRYSDRYNCTYRLHSACLTRVWIFAGNTELWQGNERILNEDIALGVITSEWFCVEIYQEPCIPPLDRQSSEFTLNINEGSILTFVRVGYPRYERHYFDEIHVDIFLTSE